MKKTVVVGASENPARYAFRAAEMLKAYGHPIVPLGISGGEVAGEEIQDIRKRPPIEGVDTVTLYINRIRQKEWEDYLLELHPKRIIFNPGAENESFEERASKAGIEVVEACTLVLLRSGQYD